MTATITLTNTAPSSGLPDYVSGAATVTQITRDGRTLFRRNDPDALPPYQSQHAIGIYGSVGARVASTSEAMLSDPVHLSRKHPFVIAFTVLPPAGGTHTFTVTWTEPSAGRVHAPVITPTPNAPVVHIDVPACG